MNNEAEKPTVTELNEQAATPTKKIHGGRNLMIMGFGAFVIAFISTATSLFIYHETGDIYLDRSRPGYIFEDEKHNAADDKKEAFPNDGAVTAETLDDYLRELDDAKGKIDALSDDFSLEPLSDESLDIVND